MNAQFVKTGTDMNLERRIMPDETKLLTPEDEVIKERLARKFRKNLNKKQLEDKIKKMK